jgi:hypothetical protein
MRTHSHIRKIVYAALLMSTQVSEAVDFANHCPVSKPPKSAELQISHGLDFYAHPKDLSTTYTGCQYMWLADGTLLYRMFYANGTILWAKGHAPGEEDDESICYYVAGKLNRVQSINPSGCPKS